MSVRTLLYIPFPEYNLGQHIGAVCCYAIFCCITLGVFIKEHRKRVEIRQSTEQSKLDSTTNDKWLGIFSMCALFSCVLCLFGGVLMKTPVVCMWKMQGIMGNCWICVQGFLTYYQIARLKYCFSAKYCEKYGYSNRLFKILYIWGTIAILFGFIIDFIIYAEEDKGNLGCIYSATKWYVPLVYLVYSPLFYIWDWTVLVLYIIKMVQFTRKKTVIQNDMNDIVYQKVKFLLEKMLLLTIIYEVTGGIVLFFQGLVDSNFLWSITVSLDITISSFIVFLMIEHNNDYYLKLIRTLNSAGLCCCCKSLINAVVTHEIEKNMEQMSSKNKNGNSEKNKNGNVNNDINDETMCETRDISTKYEPKHQITYSEDTIVTTQL